MPPESNPPPTIDTARFARPRTSIGRPSKLLEAAAIAHPQWALNRAAFHRMLPDLLSTHRDRFVAIHGGRLVGEGENAGQAAEQALVAVGPVEIYVDQVTETPRVYRIPGPRIGRSEISD